MSEPSARSSSISVLAIWNRSAGRWVAKLDAIGDLAELVSLADLAVGRRDGEGGEPFLDLAPGPEQRLDDLFGLQAEPGGR